MSQFGMQMPGGQVQRGPSLNVYTGLLFLAVISLLGASVIVYIQATKSSPGGQPFKLQELDPASKGYKIDFPDIPGGETRGATPGRAR